MSDPSSQEPANPRESASMVDRELRPGESIVWSGRPSTTLAPGDGEAALVAAVTLFGTLGIASALHLDERVGIPPLGFPLAALAGCVLGLVFVLTRVAGAGRPLTIGLAGLAPLFAVATTIGGAGKAGALVCPACSLGFLLLWVALRWVEHRSVRYYLTRARGFIEEPGRYLISFELDGEPVARPSRLAQGRVGAIELTAARGTIRTNRGVLMPVPAGRRRFVRIPFPAEVIKAWRGESR